MRCLNFLLGVGIVSAVSNNTRQSRRIRKCSIPSVGMSTVDTWIIFEPPPDKINILTCAPSEDSDQPGHPTSLIGVFACAQWVAKDPSFLHAHSEDSDQTGRMPRLI